MVVKADGLAAGKGVIICDDFEDAARAIDEMLLGGAFGDAGRYQVEERLIGEEVSFIAQAMAQPQSFATSQDHKRIGEGDTGLNTGGMGAYSPAPQVGPEMTKRVMAEVISPTMAAMRRGAIHSSAFCMPGLCSESGPVLEFNVRLGDPETQPLMMRLQSDYRC